MYKIGIDLGGTKIEGILLDEELNEISRKRISTEQEKGYDHILQNIANLYEDLASKIKSSNISLGIGTPGSVSKKTGLLQNSNTTALNGMPFIQDLEKKIGKPIGIENDANCFAMAEALAGAGKGKDLVFGVIMGTGCGGAIVYKGQLISGLQGIAGEWGHVTIDPLGPKCYCGKRGCIETYISGGGLEARYAEKSSIKKSLKEIIEAYKKGEPATIEFIEEFFKNFGIALSNLINILDPDIIVIGGGVSNFDELYSLGVEQVKKYVFNDSLDTPIVKNLRGDSAGVYGAALIGK